MAELLKTGSKIPEFETVDQQGNSIGSKAIKGKPAVIYFYPKDDTPGCTVEACEFRDNISQFREKGVNVFGVSVDDQKSHKKFEEKFNLNFPLLVDSSKKISEQFGVLGERSAKRVTFIVDSKGTVVYVYPKVSPKGHTEEVMNKLKELKLVN